jgi:hypothetical protein
MFPWVIRFIAMVIVGLCLFLQFKVSGGWFTIIGIFLWPLVGLMHLVAHSMKLPRSGKIEGSQLTLITVSHLLFIVAFLLQYDQGDGPGWLTITAWLRDSQVIGSRQPPKWWPDELKNNFVLFIPVIVTWVLLLRSPGRQPSAAVGSGPSDG